MNRCFIPQAPTRYDKTLDLRRSTIDFSPAQKFGELVVCLPPDVSPFNVHPVAIALREKMADFDSDDYLVAVGDPTLIGIAFHIAAQRTGGKFNQLKWDKFTGQYFKVRIDLPQ